MDNFKTFYNEKNGKAILFFGFYLIFFIFLFFYMRSIETRQAKNGEKEETPQVDKITTYDISNLINNDYNYTIEILDNDQTINFSGTKNDIDYANYANKYFLDIYNLNQLLKKSKLVNSENYVLSYELSNKEINEILLTDKKNENNQIDVYVNDKTEVEKIVLDLSNYLEKEKYQITINYEIGDKNEDSSS